MGDSRRDLSFTIDKPVDFEILYHHKVRFIGGYIMKKRIFAISFALILIISVFCGCSANVGKQMELAVINTDLWAIEVEDGTTVYSYAVTDLDKNGRIEIVASMNYGSANITETKYYEVSESGDSLTELEHIYTGDSQADVTFGSAKCYKDKDSGQIYYVFTDINKKNIRESYTSKIALTLFEGKVTEEVLAVEASIYNDSTEEYDLSYTDGQGNAISESRYNTIEASRFEGYKTMSATFGWKGYTYQKHITTIYSANGDLEKLLWDSYNLFKVK